MPFPIGSSVVVRTLGNKRGVVVAADNSGRYRVRVENVTASCREEDLAEPPARTKTRGQAARLRSGEAPARASARHAAMRRGHTRSSDDAAPAGRVDLHGLRVEEAIARMVREIDRALLRGADRVEVVHGKGSGRIKVAVHRYLATLPVVAAFKVDPQNAGVTWVHLR